MIIRPAIFDDYSEIMRICRQDFDNAGITFVKPKVADRVALDNDGSIIAYGAIYAMLDAKVAFDMDKPRITRAKAYKQLLLAAEHIAKTHGEHDIHVFAVDSHIREMLLKCGYRELNPILCKDV